MSLFRRLCLRTPSATRPMVVRRHLLGVEGLEHVPSQGPFVLISNHTSFADHFFFDALLFAARGDQGVFLTKAESFRGAKNTWFEAMGAVPVDRDAPARELLAVADRILSAGKVLVVYPEGTRNRTPSALMPFKDGGFRFAERAGVPVVPAALWGVQDILPIGAKVPRGGVAKVVFGPPLHADPALPRAARIRQLAELGEQAVAGLLTRARTGDPATTRDAARRTAELADAVLELSVSGTDTVDPVTRYRQADLLLAAVRRMDRDCLAAEAAAARLAGLRAMAGGRLMRIPRVLSVRAKARRVLRRDPDHLMAHYLMGRWHLQAPALLGGRTARAVAHFAIAERLGGTDSRYAMGHAEALQAAGRSEEALAALARVIAAPAPDPRTRHRSERARALRDGLLGCPAPARPAEEAVS